MWADKPF
ncbi:uncharacterized protein FFFS_06302 [Fusarium fujikuroi]|nr:uncharacterized protein FFFS_06302 [Fusarium fujikuroi]